MKKTSLKLILYFGIVIEIVTFSNCLKSSNNNRIKLVTNHNEIILSTSDLDQTNHDNPLKISKIEESKLKMADSFPIVINTWDFVIGAQKAWEALESGGSVLDAVEMGCSACEAAQCDKTVGFGGSPDENGETTLDAMIMDGETHGVGAVSCLRRIKNAISVARKILTHTKHSLLTGELATAFAIQMGFNEESLSTPESIQMHQEWKNNSCQPNFWTNVTPDPNLSCGPYSPISPNSPNNPVSPNSLNIPISPNSTNSPNSPISPNSLNGRSKNIRKHVVDKYNHDTIGMVVVDKDGRIGSGTSSNGARNKIPGRVGDAPIVGAGSYVDKDVGGAAATGDGDIMMRFLPSLIAVEKMRDGLSPKEAGEEALRRVAKFYPQFSGAIVVLNLKGEYGAACHNIEGGFPYSVRNKNSQGVEVKHVDCFTI